MESKLYLYGGSMKIPAKPKTQRAQIDMMWDALFNGIPHRLKSQDIRINFILAFMALILAFMAVIMIRLI